MPPAEADQRKLIQTATKPLRRTKIARAAIKNEAKGRLGD